MRWIRYSKICDITVIWLLNNRVFFFCQPFPKGYEFKFRIYLPALPFQHYLKLAFNKPFEYWEWLEFKLDIDFSKGLGLLTKLTLCKFDLITELAKKGAKNV